MNRRPKAYESSALPLSYSGIVFLAAQGDWEVDGMKLPGRVKDFVPVLSSPAADRLGMPGFLHVALKLFDGPRRAIFGFKDGLGATRILLKIRAALYPVDGVLEEFGPAFALFQTESAAKPFHLTAKEILIADVRYDNLWFACVEHARGRARTAMVDHDRSMPEELIVRYLPDDLDVAVFGECRELGPAALHDDFAVAGPGAEKSFHGGAGIVVHHAAKGDDRNFLTATKLRQFTVEAGVRRRLPAAVTGEAEARVDLGVRWP